MKKKAFLSVLVLFLFAIPVAAQVPGFTPGNGNSLATCPVPTSLSVTGTSSNTALDSVAMCGQSLILYNIGSQEAFYLLGTSNAVAATTASYSIPGNTYVVLSLMATQTYLAAITSTSTTTIRVLQGTVH